MLTAYPNIHPYICLADCWKLMYAFIVKLYNDVLQKQNKFNGSNYAYYWIYITLHYHKNKIYQIVLS